jgi:hypothetical protein
LPLQPSPERTEDEEGLRERKMQSEKASERRFITNVNSMMEQPMA